jgi:hypothetical protein
VVVLGLHRHQVPILVQVRLEITLFFHLSLQTEAAVVAITHPLVLVGRAVAVAVTQVSPQVVQVTHHLHPHRKEITVVQVQQIAPHIALVAVVVVLPQ